jgi:ketosteroid isomerase-like protein
MSVNTKAIVAQVNAAFAAGSTEGFLACCTDDVAWTMVGDTTGHGKDAIRQWMTSMGPMEPPQLTVHNVIAEGDCVTAYGDMTMKDKDGAVVPYAYCDIYHFRGEKIVELRAFVIPTAATSQTSPGAS